MLQIETVRFGIVEIDDNRLIKFEEGLFGLEEYKTYAFLHIEQSYPIIWMQCVTDGGVALPVIDTFSVIPDYAFDLGDEDVKALDLKNPGDAQVVSVLVIPDNIEQMTINLAAPIVFNVRTGQAKQIVLNGSDYSVRAPIFVAVCRLLREEESADASAVPEAK